MKKLLAVILSAVLVTPVYAQHHHHHHGGSSNWVAPLVLGGVIGAMVARPSPPPVYVAPQPVYNYNPIPTYYTCLIQVYDPYTGTYRNEAATCVR